MAREESAAPSVVSSLEPVAPAASRRSFQPMPTVSNLPYQSPLNTHVRNRQLQQQRQRYSIMCPSPTINCHQSPDISNHNRTDIASNHNSNVNTANHNRSNIASKHNNNVTRNIQTFQSDPILHPDDKLPPSPSQSSSMTQEQHDYIDQLLVDAVVLGKNPFTLFDQHHMRKLVNFLVPSYEIPGEKTVGGSLLNGLEERIKREVNKVCTVIIYKYYPMQIIPYTNTIIYK